MFIKVIGLKKDKPTSFYVRKSDIVKLEPIYYKDGKICGEEEGEVGQYELTDNHGNTYWLDVDMAHHNFLNNRRIGFA